MTRGKKLLIAAAVVVIAAVLVVLCFMQVIKPNALLAMQYEVRGVDVSEYQGDIDWSVLSDGLDFAYIKATEGSGYTDERFAYNCEQARASGIRVGAYHFFSFDSSGKTQAENFIANVEPYDGMLPPVVDVEFYGDYFKAPKTAEDVLPELENMLSALESRYDMKPVIYTTDSAYRIYIKGTDLESYPQWRRNVYLKPSGSWDFWQYSSVGRLDGYSGDEKYIDVNVFRGSREELESYGIVK